MIGRMMMFPEQQESHSDDLLRSEGRHGRKLPPIPRLAMEGKAVQEVRLMHAGFDSIAIFPENIKVSTHSAGRHCLS